MSHISSNLLKQAFATWQHLFLSTSTAFYDIFVSECAVFGQESDLMYVFRLYGFFNFFSPFPFLFFLSFYNNDSLSTGLASSLIIYGKHHQDRHILPRNFAPHFSLKFLNIFMHIFGSTEPITLIWVSLERPFSSAELEYRWCQFWAKVMMSEEKQRPTLITTGYYRHGSQ